MTFRSSTRVRASAAAAALLTGTSNPASAAPERATPMALTGVSYPSVDSLGRPRTFQFYEFAHPSIAHDGTVHFRVMAGGVVPPTFPGVRFYGGETTLNGFRYQALADSGKLAVGELDWSNIIYPDRTEETVALRGQPRPGGNGVWTLYPRLYMNPSGRFVVSDDATVYTGTSLSDMTLVAQTGQTLAGQTLGKISGGTITRDGRILFNDVAGGSYAVNATNPASPVRLLGPGDPVPASAAAAPGTTFSSAGPAYANTSGGFVVQGQLPAGPSLWKGKFDDPTALTKIYAPGDSLPGAPGTQVERVYRQGMSRSGRVFFTASLTGPTVTGMNWSGLWTGRSSADLKLIGRSGDPANLPGLPATATWGAAFTYMLATNDNDQAVFATTLNGVSSPTPYTQALIGYDPSLGLVTLVKGGDVLEVSPGVNKTVARFSHLYRGDDRYMIDGGTNEGLDSNLNDSGEVVYRAAFTDGTYGIFKTRVPVAGDATSDGIVDSEDFQILLAHYGQASATPDRGTGDFNLDGRVDFADYQLLEGNYGRRPPGVAAPAPVDFGAWAATLPAVPEPTAGALLIGAALVGLGRRRPSRIRRTSPTV